MALFVCTKMKYPLLQKLAFWKSNWNSSSKSFSMVGNVNAVEKDQAGNIWYINALSKGLQQIIGGKSDVFDMLNLADKRKALIACTPFATVVERCGSMFSNGRFYVTDKEDNEHLDGDNKYNKIRTLLKQPNPIQSGKQFNKQVEITLKTFGFCPIYTFRALRSEIPVSMWIIPPELFHAEVDANIWKKSRLEEVIKKAWIEWGSENIYIESDEYFVVSDASANINVTEKELSYIHITDSLTRPVNNWIAQMIARGTLIVDGGPKGVLCNDANGDVYGDNSLTPGEIEKLNESFKRKYGVVGKLFSVLVTTANVKWVPITGNSEDLKLYQEDKECRNTICNSLGINPNVLISDSTYDNQNGAKRDAYQDLIIPDSENYCETLTKAIVGDDEIIIRLDFFHISVLQEDKKSAASALSLASNAVRNLYNDGIITLSESRKEVANYIDIDPDNPEGDFKQESQSIENNIQNGTQAEK